MIGGIILTHGQIASATLEAAETILGKTDNLYALSTAGLSLKSLITKLEEIITSENWEQGVVIMASLKGGTCWNAAVATARHKPNVEVVSGVNLIMLISFLTKRNQITLSDLAATIYNDAIRGIDRLLTN